MPAGRPTTYTPEIGNEICERIAEGETLRSICADSHMPAKSTVLLWVVDQNHQEFSDQYMIAREAAGYNHADRTLDVVGKIEEGSLDPNAGRVMLTGLHWAAERMAPKKHSPRQEVTGAGGGPVAINEVRRKVVDPQDGESG